MTITKRKSNFASVSATLLCLIVFVGCTSSNEKIRYGEYFIKGEIKIQDRDTVLNGPIEYYDSAGNLIFVTNFKEGIMHGFSQEFYKGKIKQEVNYHYGIQNGFTVDYDTTGHIVYRTNYFYGIPAGPQFFYRSDSVSKYIFVSLENRFLYKCSYENDSTILEEGKLLNYYAHYAGSEEGLNIELLMYLMNPPHKKLTYKLFDKNVLTGDSVLIYQTSFKDSFFQTTYVPMLQRSHKYLWDVEVFYSKQNVVMNNILSSIERELKVE